MKKKLHSVAVNNQEDEDGAVNPLYDASQDIAIMKNQQTIGDERKISEPGDQEENDFGTMEMKS